MLSVGPGRAGVRHFPRRPLEPASCHTGCCRLDNECGGDSKDYDLQARLRNMKSCGGRIRTYDLQVMSEENLASKHSRFPPFLYHKYMIIWDK